MEIKHHFHHENTQVRSIMIPIANGSGKQPEQRSVRATSIAQDSAASLAVRQIADPQVAAALLCPQV
eukprot:3932741-Rhodomonas_salina.3